MKPKDAQDWEHVPAYLSHSQREDPIDTVCNFSHWDSLFKMRFYLQYMFEAAMSSKLWKDQTPKDKGDQFWFFNELMDLLESSYLLDEMLDEGKLTYSIKPKKI
ncbi:MAG TPA: hypothetical protein VK563_20390 [Puia sp.]|nr:hypothetical protein [Puia sp.]